MSGLVQRSDKRFTSLPNGKRAAARIMTTVLLGLSLCAAIALRGPQPCAADAAVAIVTDLEGSAWVEEGGRATSVHILASLRAKTEFQLAAGSKITLVFLDSGNEYSVRAEDETATVHVTPSELQAGAAASVTSRQLGMTDALGTVSSWVGQRGIQEAGFRVRGAAARDAAERVALVDPSNESVFDLRPEFRWVGGVENSQFRIVLADAQGNVLEEGRSDKRTFRFATELQMGTSYTWHVEATSPDGETDHTRPADFRTLETREREAVERYRPPPDASISKRVFYASFLESLGLHQQARALWKNLAAQRANDPVLGALAQQ